MADKKGVADSEEMVVKTHEWESVLQQGKLLILGLETLSREHIDASSRLDSSQLRTEELEEQLQKAMQRQALIQTQAWELQQVVEGLSLTSVSTEIEEMMETMEKRNAELQDENKMLEEMCAHQADAILRAQQFATSNMKTVIQTAQAETQAPSPSPEAPGIEVLPAVVAVVPEEEERGDPEEDVKEEEEPTVQVKPPTKEPGRWIVTSSSTQTHPDPYILLLESQVKELSSQLQQALSDNKTLQDHLRTLQPADDGAFSPSGTAGSMLREALKRVASTPGGPAPGPGPPFQVGRQRRASIIDLGATARFPDQPEHGERGAGSPEGGGGGRAGRKESECGEWGRFGAGVCGGRAGVGLGLVCTLELEALLCACLSLASAAAATRMLACVLQWAGQGQGQCWHSLHVAHRCSSCWYTPQFPMASAVLAVTH